MKICPKECFIYIFFLTFDIPKQTNSQKIYDYTVLYIPYNRLR